MNSFIPPAPDRSCRSLITVAFLLILLVPVFAGSPPRPHKAYHANGRISEKGHYDGEARQGLWVYYNEQGLIEKKEKWKAGQLRWQMFFNKGKVTKIIDRDGKVTIRPACGC